MYTGGHEGVYVSGIPAHQPELIERLDDSAAAPCCRLQTRRTSRHLSTFCNRAVSSQQPQFSKAADRLHCTFDRADLRAVLSLGQTVNGKLECTFLSFSEGVSRRVQSYRAACWRSACLLLLRRAEAGCWAHAAGRWLTACLQATACTITEGTPTT
jgi:hypothetical protein